MGASVTFEGSALGSSDQIFIQNEAAGFIGSWAHTLVNGTSDFAAYDPQFGVEPLSTYNAAHPALAYWPRPQSRAQEQSVPEPTWAGLLAAAGMAVTRKRKSIFEWVTSDESAHR